MKFRHQWIPAAIVTTFLFVPPSFARLSMDASVGFDGEVLPQSWAPVLVELFNDGPSVEGYITVESAMPSGAAVYSKPVVLPSNSRKRVWLYPHVGNFEREFDVRLVAPNGRELDQTTAQFKTLPPDSQLVVSATRSEMNLLPLEKKAGDGSPLFVGRMRPVALPDDPAGYEGLETLLLTDASESEWSVGQRRAIRHWVAFGGHLIVSANSADNFIHSRFWEELLPLRVTGSTVVSDLAALETVAAGPSAMPRQQTPVAVGELERGTVRAKSGDTPLVIDAPFGRGRVTFLTFSIERPPFRSWAGQEPFWRTLVESHRLVPIPAPAGLNPNSPIQAYQGWGGVAVDDMFRGMFESKLERQISFWWLLILIGCYLLVIGPFDYWLVRHKLKRPVLTWVTFPGYVIGFSALIYGIGYSLKSGDSQLMEVSFVDVVAGSNLAQGTTVAGFYSTSNRHYRFQSSKPESHFRLLTSSFENRSTGPEFGDKTRVMETDRGYDASVNVPIWSSKTMIARWDTADRVLGATAEQTGGSVRLRLRNELPIQLTRIVAIGNGSVTQLTDLRPNQSQDTLLVAANGQSFDRWLKHDSASFLDHFRNWGVPFLRTDPRDMPPWSSALVALSFTGSLRASNPDARLSTWPGLDLSKQADPRHLIVLAYAEDFPLSGLQPAFKPDKIQHHALLRCVLNLEPLNSEPRTLPPQADPPEVENSEP